MRSLLLVPLVAIAALPLPATAGATEPDRASARALPVERGAPVAGRFCKTADAGKRRRDANGRTLRCQKKGGHYRWVVIAG